MRPFFVAALALLTLAACGDRSLAPGAVQGALGRVMGQRGQVAQPDLRKTLTPGFIAGFEGPLMYAALPARSVQAGLVPTVRNGSVQQWVTPDGVSVSFDRGVVTATRGLGGDLMSSDLDDVQSALRSGAIQGERVHRYLNKENQLVVRAFKCEYVHTPGGAAQTLVGQIPALFVAETCFDSTGEQFDNEFWVDSAGRVRKSKQWLGPFIGYLETELLKVQ